MQLRWLGAAGFELKTANGTVLLIDPYLSRPPAARPQSPVGLADIASADAIFVTHGHFDHAFDVPALANRLDAPVFASACVCQTLAQHDARGSLLSPLSPAESVQVGDLQVHALAARHVRFDLLHILQTLPRLLPHLRWLRPLLSGWPAGQVLGFQVTAPNFSLVHFGSAGWVEEAMEGIHPDVVLIPAQPVVVGGPGGRSDIAHVVARMAALLRPRLVVPHHWDDFYPPISQLVPLEPFVEALSHLLPTTRLHVPEMGRWWVVPGEK